MIRLRRVLEATAPRDRPDLHEQLRVYAPPFSELAIGSICIDTCLTGGTRWFVHHDDAEFLTHAVKLRKMGLVAVESKL